MATLSVISNFSMSSAGITYSGKQGTTTDSSTTSFDITVDGTIHTMRGSLATASVVTVWDDDDDTPADFDYLFYWADQDSYIQIIGPTMNVIFKVEAKVPYWQPGFDTMNAAANATAITGGAEPSMSDIDSIIIGNYSGTTMAYVFAVID